MADNREARYRMAADAILSGLNGDAYTEALAQIKFLVDDWYEGAGNIDPDDLYRIGLSDLKTALADVPPSNLLEKLRALVLERKVETLSARAFSLARRVVDGELSPQSAKGEVKSIASEIDSLLPEVRQLKDAALKERCLRELADADLERRYVEEGNTGAMSIRLNQYMHR